MSGVNKVIIIGNLGRDPEVKYLSDSSVLCSLAVATSESWKDKQSGEKKEKTEWHNITFFGRLAEIAGEYLRKGSKVYVEGSLTTRKWQDSDGNDRYATSIKGRELQMLDSKGQQGQPQESRPPQQQQRPTQQQSNNYQQNQSGQYDDDIPF